MAQLTKADVQIIADEARSISVELTKLEGDKACSSPELGQVKHHATELVLALDRLAATLPETEEP